MKIFACSDIHSYFTPFKKALDEKGFEPGNPEHLLVVCGDVFDRGPESREVFEFLNNLTNVILVKGNHEDLMEAIWERGYCIARDQSNGTLRTIVDMFSSSEDEEVFDIIYKSKEVLEPFFAKMVDYFETKNYVFVHGWLPMKYDMTKKFAEYGDPTLFDPNWREGDWEHARWFNGMRQALKGVVVPDKITICGHWHCSYGHMRKSLDTENWLTEFEEDAIWEPFEAEGIIAIDRCTAHTGEVNVIVLEDELL